MAPKTLLHTRPEGLSEIDRGGYPPLFLYNKDFHGTLTLAGLALGENEILIEPNNAEQNASGYQVIARWCGKTMQPDGRFGDIAQRFTDLIPGQRVFHDGYMHGGTLREGKTALEESRILPNGAIVHGLWFMLPVTTGDNPNRVKNLPIPPDELIVGDENIVAALSSRLLESPTVDERSIFLVEKYIRVARSMKSLGWDVSIDHTDIPYLEKLCRNIHNFTQESVAVWIKNSSVLPNSLLTGLLQLSEVLGETYLGRTKDSLALQVAKNSWLKAGGFKVDEKIVAVYTSFLQDQQKPIITRQEARDKLTMRGNDLFALSKVGI